MRCVAAVLSVVFAGTLAGARAVTLPLDSCDVAVIGGGVAGVAAAAQSGRAGAKTILIEQGFQCGVSPLELPLGELKRRLAASGAIVPNPGGVVLENGKKKGTR